MVWMMMNDRENHSLYLEINTVEQRFSATGSIYAVQAMVGNGIAETALLLEIGSTVSVTFVDEWLDIESYRAFIAGYDRSQLEEILAETTQTISFCTLNPPGGEQTQVLGYQCDGRWEALPGADRPHQLHLPTLIAENTPVWRSVA